MLDTHVYLGRWPSRPLPDEGVSALSARLRRHGVTQAWAGNFDGIFQEDLGAVNSRLAAACSASGILVPFGSVNPRLPGWREHLRRCHEQHRIRGIRLHPGYHGYRLDDPQCAALLREAAGRGMLVQVVLAMEDERTVRPPIISMRADAAPLVALVDAIPGLRVVLSNHRPPLPIRELAATGRVWFDFAMREGLEGVRVLSEQAGARQVVFGSMAPLFYFESALLKVREAALPSADAELILGRNARELYR